MHVSFTTTPVETPEPSLAYRMGVEGVIKFRTMGSGIRLVYEDNDEELVQCWVAEPKRYAIIEQETEYKLTSKWVLA